MSLGLLDALILGVVEGLTEFLPVSSTGHLTITEGLLGLPVDDPAVTGFTAVIQTGAIAAVLLFFRSDIARFVRALGAGLRSAQARQGPDWTFTLAVVVGSLPISVVGLALKNVIEGPALRSLVTVGIALIVWSGAMLLAERRATQVRGESDVRVMDGLVIGLVQCIALVPGVSRAGATISAGLVRGIDRVTATRLSFFLAIPALTAAGALQLPAALGGDIGIGPVLVGTAVSFVVAYASIAFLLRFVASHAITAFVPYRLLLGATVLVVLAVK